MPTFPVIDEWNKDPEFQKLPYNVRRQKIEAYFDAYHADPEFRALPEGRQAEIKNRMVIAHLGEAPAPPAAPATAPEPTTGQKWADAPGAFIDGWTQASLDIPKTIGTAMEYGGHRVANFPQQMEETAELRPETAFAMLSPSDQARVGQLISSDGVDLASAIRRVRDYEGKKVDYADAGETIRFMGEGVREYYEDLQKPYKTPADLEGKNVWDHPELLADPRWWAYGTGNMGPSLVATLLPAGAVRTGTIRIGSLVVPKTPQSMARLSKLATVLGAGAGGLAGGTMEAAQTYETVFQETGDERQAARAAEMMGLFAGGLNSVGNIAFLEALGSKLISKMAIQGAIEGVTEGMEEPAEVGAKALAKLMREGRLPDNMREQFKEAFKEALTVAPIAAITGAGGAVASPGQSKDLTKQQEVQQKAERVLDDIMGESDQASNAPDIETVPPGSLDTRQDGTIMPPAGPPDGPVFANGSESTLTPPNIETVGAAASETAGFSGLGPGFDLLSGYRDEEPPQAPAGQVNWNPVDKTQQATEMMHHAGMQLPESAMALPPGQGFELQGEPYTPQVDSLSKTAENESQTELPLTDEPQQETELDQAAQEAATSPANDIPEPTEAQIKAGNYKKGHVNFHGLDISIENPKGSTRKGTDADGKLWETDMVHHYGYIRRTEGKDGDQVDIFMGPDQESDRVFVVDQVDPETGKFDEHKVMLGFSSREAAIQGYLDNYADDWQGLGDVTGTDIGRFKDWLKDGDSRKPFAHAAGEGIERRSGTDAERDRRKDPEERKRVADMTMDELRTALFTSPKADLPNARAYEESQKRRVQGSIDADGLKWVNDNLGHAAGDTVISMIGEGLAHSGLDVYHVSGDEFVAQTDDEAEFDAGMQRAYDYLQDNPIVVETPDGETYTFTGGFSYATDQDLEQADLKLQEAKQARTLQGKRAERGERPPGLVVEPATGKQGDDRGQGVHSPGQTEPKLSPPKKRKRPPLKKPGQKQPIASMPATVVDAQRIDGVDYELYQAGSRSAVRVYDVDAREVVDITLYSKWDMAVSDFNKAVEGVGGNPYKEATDDAKWWDKELSIFGRRRVLKAAGVNLPDRVTWRNISVKNRNRILAAKWVADEAPQDTTPTPQPAPGSRKVEDLEGTPDEEIDAVLDDVFGPAEKPKPKTGKLAKEVGIEAVAGVKQAVKGLSKLFTPKNTVGMGAVFNEDTYKEAKPHFESALKHAVKAGHTLKDLVKHLHNLFGDQIRPYLDRFLKEKAQGENASNDVEKPETTPKKTKKEKALEAYRDFVEDLTVEQFEVVRDLYEEDPAAPSGLLLKMRRALKEAKQAKPKAAKKAPAKPAKPEPPKKIPTEIDRSTPSGRYYQAKEPERVDLHKEISELRARAEKTDGFPDGTLVALTAQKNNLEHGTGDLSVIKIIINEAKEEFAKLTPAQSGTTIDGKEPTNGRTANAGTTKKSQSSRPRNRKPVSGSTVRTKGAVDDGSTSGVSARDDGEGSGSTKAKPAKNGADGGSSSADSARGGQGSRPDRRSGQSDSEPTPDKEERSGVRSGAVDGRAKGKDSDLGAGTELAPEDQNHVIGPDDVIAPPGVEGKINANITAIRLAKQLVEQERNPSPEEKKVLVKYVGWGAFAQKVFNREFTSYLKSRDNYTPDQYFYGDKAAKYKDWEKRYGKKLHPELGGLLTQDEWDAAAESTLNAHYTSREIIDATWSLLRHLGFKGGKIVEPSAGVGHYFGLMPERIAANSELNAVELDPITGMILSKLYPQARVQITGYEDATGIPDNSQDLVVSNFPFGKYTLYDKKRPQYKTWSIHNYFFGRSIDAVRPGGLVVGVTSHYTMDAKSGGKIRADLNDKADFIGGIRLPYTAFKKNAGTEVVTDILVFRKKDGQSHGLGQDFRISQEIEIGKDGSAFINEYFAKHPEMVLGKNSLKGSMYHSNEYTVEPAGDLEAALEDAIAKFPANVAGQGKAAPAQVKTKYADLGDRDGVLLERDGEVYMVEDGQLKAPSILDSKGRPTNVMENQGRARRVHDYLALKDVAKRLIDRMQDEEATDVELAKLRKELNQAYDHFVKRNREIGQTANSFLRNLDIEFPVVDALEVVKTKAVQDKIKSGPNKGKLITKEVKTFSKPDIFAKRTIHPFKEPDTADNLTDALAISLLYRNAVDVGYIAELLGLSEEQVERDLVESEKVFRDPETGLLEPPDVYLTGPVRHKLNVAKENAIEDKSLERNVKALERVQPAPLDIEFIYFRLGTSWVPAGAVKGFLKETMDLDAKVTMVRTGETVSWNVRPTAGEKNAKNAKTWGTKRRSGHELVNLCLNHTRAVIYDTIRENGSERRVKDVEATEEAIEKQADIQAEFTRWGKAHKEWGPKLADEFNEQVNGYVLRKFPDPEIKRYPGASQEITLRPLQRRFVSRALQESTLFAHGVGTGKTFSYVSTAMEMRRLGTARKPMIVVQNSTVGQYSKAFGTLYPQARVLIPTDKQRQARNRQRLLTMVATGDWDAIVLPHSFFDGIADDPDREIAFVEEQLDMIEAAIDEAEAAEGKDSFTVKEMMATKKRKEARLRALVDRRKDSAMYFEKLGVDALLIDEAHNYKRSEFFTKMGNVKGIDQGSSQRSTSLVLKAEYVRQKTGGKNVILATGTPISNTTAELWTMMRYVRPDLLAEYGVELFDDFAGTFGETTIALEETESGTYKEVERFNRYVNGHQLLTMFHTAADVQLTQDAGLNLPDIAGGKPESVIVPRSDDLSAFIDELRDTREWWEGLTGKEKRKNRHVPLVLFGLAKKAAIDMRLVDPSTFKDDPNNKLSEVANSVVKIWKETKANSSTQAIFLDSYRDRDHVFNAYHELRRKMVEQGIPAEQIAIVTEAGTDAKREAMFQRVRDGKDRVIIGSTQKLGVGVNIQDKLIALHHVDAPPRPMDIEQRNGRGVREGNENPVIRIFNYGTQATLDSVMYDRLVKKQRFIDQMLTGDIEGSAFEDPLSEEQLSLAEQNAAFSGNPLVFEKSEAEANVKKLRRAKSRHERNVSLARRTVRDIEADIQNGEQALEAAKKRAKFIGRLVPELDLNSFEVDGNELTRKKFRSWLADQFDDHFEKIAPTYEKGITWKKFQDRDEGLRDTVNLRFKINGMDVSLDLEPALDWPWERKARTKGKFEGIVGTLAVDYKGEALIRAHVNTAAGMLRTLKNRLESQLDRPDSIAREIDQAKKDLAENERLGKQEFEKAQELEDAEKRLADIEERLLAIEREKPADDKKAEGPGTLNRYLNTPGSGSPAKPASEFYAFTRDEGYQPVEDAKAFKVIDGVDTFVAKDAGNGKTWTVSEARTGLRVSSGATRKAAVETARRKIEQVGLDSLKETIDRHIAEHGPSPWVVDSSGKSGDTGQVKEKAAKYEPQKIKVSPSKVDQKFGPAKRPQFEGERTSSRKPALDAHQSIRVSTTGRILGGSRVVRDVNEAASLLASIRKSAQELTYTVTTDKDGNVLEIHRYSKGAVDRATVDPFEIAGRVLNVDGAHTTYFVHNHPSGGTRASADDKVTSQTIAAILELGDVSTRSLVIGGTRYQEIDLGSSFNGYMPGGSREIMPSKRQVSLPIKERSIRKRTPFDAVGMPIQTLDHLKSQGRESTDGFLFLDNQNKPVGFLELKSGSTWKDVTRNVLAAAETIGARGMIFNNARRRLDDYRNNRLNYLQRLNIATQGHIKLLDVVDQGSSMVESGAFGSFFGKYDGVSSTAVSPGERTAKLQVLNTDAKVVFSNRKGDAGAVSLTDVQAVFKGQEVGIRADGNGFWIKLKNGKTLTVQNVEHIDADTVQFKAAYGDVDPEAISGAYSSTGTISISEHFGDKWTLTHEMAHALEDMGMLNKLDVNVLRNHIRKLAEKGKFRPANPDDIGGIEDRANFIQDTLAARAEEKGPLGRVLQKLSDFFTRFANLFKRTAGGIVSDIESGQIFERQAVLVIGGGTEQYKLADILTREMPDNWTVKESNDLGKRERFTRPPAWIAKKFPAFRMLFERQRSREKERTKQMAKTLEEIKSFLELEGEDLDMLRELIWKLEGEKIPAMEGYKKFRETEDGGYELNPQYYAVLGRYLKSIDGLSDATVEAYVDIRKSLDKDMSAVINMMQGMDDIDPTIIDEYRRQMGGIKNYFPHMRYGSHYIQAIEETEIEDPETGGTIKERRVVYREHFNAPLGVNLKKWSKFKAIEAKYPGAELTIGKVEKIPEDVFTIPIPTEAIEAVMIAAVKRVPDPKMQQAFKEILPQATADALRSRGWGSHMINRKGIPGHETDDIKRVLFDYKAGLYGWLTKVEASRDMSVTIGKIDATGKPRLWAAMRKYIHDMMANADWADQVINSMRAVFFAKYLGGNIKTAALNLTQNIIAGWPRLGMEVGKSAGMVMKASGNAIVASVTKNKRLPEDEQRLLHELLEEGVTDSNFLTEVRGQIGSNVFSASNKVMRVLGWPMGFAEGLNRSTLALAAYRAAVSGKIQRPETLAELGLDKGDKAPYEIAKRFAETVVNDAHFVYGKSNRPEALRGDVGKWGSLAYTFRTFSHNLINLWSWMYKQGGPGRKALLKSIGAMAVIGGLSSIPLYKTFMHILREATGDDWEEKLIDSWFPEQAHLMRDIIVYGVPAGMGFTLGGSVGMELPVFDKMKLNQSLTGQLGSNIGEIIGVPWAVIEDLEAAANSYRSGQKLRALEYLLPTAASNPLKAIRMHTTGQTSISGRPISDPGSNAPRKITVKETIGKAMGLQPVSSTKSWDLYKTIQAYAEFKQAKQRSFANRIANAWRAGDMKKVREVASEIEAWNKEQIRKGRYRYLMTNEDIIRALQARSRAGQPPRYLWQDTGQMMRMRGVGLQ